jgi:ABC-type Fe3+ transport system substrate-binding protein
MCDSVSNACNAIGQFGGQVCTKMGEWGGALARWTVDTGSQIASKISTFITTTVWPALQNFWAWLATLLASTVEVARTHSKEIAAAGVAGIIAGVTIITGIWCCKSLFGSNNSRKARA